MQHMIIVNEGVNYDREPQIIVLLTYYADNSF